MSRYDNILFNTNERAINPDVNNLQSLLARTISEIARGSFQRQFENLAPTSQAVAFGLTYTTPNVSPGAILLDSNVPPAGPFDSTYRLGLSLAPVDLTAQIPNPGVATWYLLEAALATAAQTIELRDVYDNFAQVFVPNTPVPKVETYGIQFRFRVGTPTTLPNAAVGWMPLVGCLFNPGGSLAQSFPLQPRPRERPIVYRGYPAILERFVRRPGIFFASWEANVAVDDGYGVLRTATFGPLDLSGPNYLEPGTVLAAGTRYYVYLVRPPLGQPSSLPALDGNGLLVLSAKAPNPGTLTPSIPLTITMPPPWPSAGLTATVVDSAIWDGVQFDQGQGTAGEDAFTLAGPAVSAGPANPLLFGQTVDLTAAPFQVPAYARRVKIAWNIRVLGSVPGTSRWNRVNLDFNAGGSSERFRISSPAYLPGQTDNVIPVETAGTIVTEYDRFYGGVLNNLPSCNLSLNTQVGNAEGEIQATVVGVSF